MSDIPSDLYHNILRRVPTDSLLRFRTVCKEWRRLIDDPSFIRSHTNNQLSSATLLIRNSDGTRLYSLSLDSLDYNNDAHQVLDVIPVQTLYRKGVPRIPELPVASCNGLMLLSEPYIEKTWLVWNPLTRELHKLPEPDIKYPRLVGSGIGYDSASDDYKVVRVDRLYLGNESVYQTRVYSLKTKSWKVIEDCPRHFPVPNPNASVFLNGVIYWRSYEFVIALDLETEHYHKLPLPPCLGNPFETHLDALGGFLVLSEYYSMKRIDEWVMKDYEWVKLFSFGGVYGSGFMWNLRPVAYLKSKGQLFLQHDKGFFMLDMQKNFAKKFTIDGLPDNFSSQFFPRSLFRLDESCDVAVESTAGMKNKYNQRFKNSVTITDTRSHSYRSDV
ncbi:hypothetical protein ACP275_10G128100 [Erythranthe tilingii]